MKKERKTRRVSRRAAAVALTKILDAAAVLNDYEKQEKTAWLKRTTPENDGKVQTGGGSADAKS